MYRLRFKVSDSDLSFLIPYFDSFSIFEDPDSEPSTNLDDNGFFIASLFNVEVFIQDKTLALLIEYLLHEEKIDYTHLNLEEVLDQDWLKLCYQNFKPIEMGRFFIHSSYAPEVVPDHKVGLMIDAATAFGSGEHQTTRGCLQAIDSLIDTIGDNAQILDMGCGSGILGLACGLVKRNAIILGVDIDAKALDVANHNATLNKIPNFKAITSDRFNTFEAKPFELIVANILAKPLITLAPQMKKNAKRYVVLSGLLSRQKDEVLAAYLKEGFKLLDAIDLDDWITLILTL